MYTYTKMCIYSFMYIHYRAKVLKEENVPLLICKCFLVTELIFFLNNSENSYI